MDRRKGIRGRSSSGIEIDFHVSSRRCRETLKLPPTPANKLYAARKREAILYGNCPRPFQLRETFSE